MPFNFPDPLPVTRFKPSLSYPLNLKADNREYFTRIRFIEYRPALLADTVDASINLIKDLVAVVSNTDFAALPGGIISPNYEATPFEYDSTPKAINTGVTYRGDTINLPIPKKINEMNMMNWSEISLTQTIIGTARSAAFAGGGRAGAGVFETAISAASIGGALFGVQINPFILQYFQRPSFREFSFTWTLAPRNRKESEQINKIIKQIKSAQAPRRAAGGVIMEYPDLAIVQFHPADEFQIELKECVIVGVNVDYTPAGPSYIGGTAAPTMVNLTIHLKETKLWWSEEWAEVPKDDFRAPAKDPLPAFDMNGALNGSMGQE